MASRFKGSAFNASATVVSQLIDVRPYKVRVAKTFIFARARRRPDNRSLWAAASYRINPPFRCSRAAEHSSPLCNGGRAPKTNAMRYYNEFETEHSFPPAYFRLTARAACFGLQDYEALLMLESHALMNLARYIYTDHKASVAVMQEDVDGGQRLMKVPRPLSTPPRFQLALPDFLPEGLDEKDPKHRALGKAMVCLRRGGGDLQQMRKADRYVRTVLSENRLEEGQPYVKVAFELLDPEQHRDLRAVDRFVLFAVNSVIGQKTFARISRKMICYREAGAKDQRAVKALEHLPGFRLLTERQIEYSLGKLVAKRLITRYVHGDRMTFVARPDISEKQLKALVLAGRVKSS